MFSRSLLARLAAMLIGAAVTSASAAGGGDPVAQVLALPKASLMLEEGGRTRIARRPDTPMIPASTMKILTALAAIQRWGLDHRFHTDLFRSGDGWLWVKGWGDPYLISEELDLVVRALKTAGLDSVAGVGADDSYFGSDVEISGRSSSDNPYDAPVTALAANFNTLTIAKSKGAVSSAEAQTPITPLGRELGQRLGSGKHRINLAQREPAVRYFGELMAAKLAAQGIEVGAGRRVGRVPAGAERIHRHHNSRDLRAMLAAMLEYSNNFIANDLFLLLGDRGDGATVSTAAAQRTAAAWASKTFGWSDFRIEDGAGLSRDNRLSARQLLQAVKAFAPYRDLLPKHKGQVSAKTGTLKGVSCYAGFVQRKGRWEPFSLLINEPVDYNLRLRVAETLARTPDLERYCPGGGC